MTLTPPTQRMRPNTPPSPQGAAPSQPMRIPMVGNSLQQLAAMRANSGKFPVLGNVKPMEPMTQTTGIPMAIPEQNTDIKQNLNEMLTATLPATVENVQKNRDNDSLASVALKGLLEKATGKKENKSNPALQRLMVAAANPANAMQSGGLISMAEGGDLKIAEGGEFSGRVPGDGHGMEDNVYMPIKEGKEQVATLAVSPSEYVVDSYTMAALGNGNSDEGADVMDETVKQIRKKAYGSEKQPNEINGLAALKPLIERV